MDEGPTDADAIVAELKERADRTRAAGGYADADALAAIELEPPDPLTLGYDLRGAATRVRFRPELGFSSKRIVGRPITAVKKLNLRLLYFVLDDLARQTDAAVVRLEAALAAEVEARAAAERELRVLARRVAELEERVTRS